MAARSSRDFPVDLHQGVLVNEHLLGKGRQPDELHARVPACESQPRRRFGGAAQAGLPAESRASGQAPLALPTKASRKADDVVPRLDVGDVGADGLDHARALVAKDSRTLEGIRPLQVVQIAVAQAGGSHPDQDLPWPGPIDAHLFDRQLPGAFEQHGGLHGSPFASAVAITIGPKGRERPQVRWRADPRRPRRDRVLWALDAPAQPG